MEDKKKLLSVIVPVYNVKRYLIKCIESICRQKYTNLEIILIDDGSSDGSEKICDEYALKDDRIKVFHKKNEGLVSARKLGVERAKGELITFVDADDWIEADMYSCMLENYIMHGYPDMVTSGLIYDWQERTQILLDATSEGVYTRKEIEECILDGLIYDEIICKQKINTSVCDKLFSASLLKQVIKRIDKNLTFGEDGALVCCFVAYAKKIAVIHKAWYHYIQHEDSMIRQYNLDSFYKIYKLKECLIKELMEVGLEKRMEKQVKYYVNAFLKNAVFSIYDIDLNGILYLFPYELVPKGSKVIIYGAGNVGISYWKCIRNNEYISLKAWVDKRYKEIKISGWNIESPKVIHNIEYDYIVIAIENIQWKNEIEQSLLQNGVSKEKIIWKPVRQCR